MDEEERKALLSRIFSKPKQAWDAMRGNIVGDIALGLTPAGYVADAQDITRAVSDRDALGVALAGLGLVPVVGDAAKVAGRTARNVVESSSDAAELARLARAREMGFKLEAEPEVYEDIGGRWYHGSSTDLEGKDFEFLRESGTGAAGPGVYMTDVPQEASEYATDAVRRTARRNEMEAAQRGVEPLPDDKLAETIYPLVHRLENPLVVPRGETVEDYITQRFGYIGDPEDIAADLAEGFDPPTRSLEEQYQAIRDSGYDSVLFEPDVPMMSPSLGGPEVRPRYLASLDEAKVRSPSARFDPSKINLKDLLAGVGGVGLGVGAMSRAQDRKDQ